jgi:hypothetical protein
VSGVRTPYRRRRGRAIVVVVLLAVIGAYVLLRSADGQSGRPVGATAGATPTASISTVDDLLARAKTNPDGSQTVTLDQGETAGLVAGALERAPSQPLRDVSVDLVAPEGQAAGRMIVAGRLTDPSLPVEAVVDLQVVDAVVQPVVRDVRVGPLPLPARAREDINRQVQELALVADEWIAVEELSTEDDRLVLTGRLR